MNDEERDRALSATLPDDDVVAIVLRQHADIREMMARVLTHDGTRRQKTFAELKDFLVGHEKAEQAVIHPVTRATAGPDVADARMREEAEADQVMAHLEHLDVNSDTFADEFAEFERAVIRHAEAEEHEELPALRGGRSPQERIEMGRSFLQEMRAAGG